MAFNLKKVLRALLFSTSQPLSVKDVQAVIARYHELAVLPEVETEAAAEGQPGETGSLSTAVPSPSLGMVFSSALAPELEDPELYREVPSLVTASQIREAMEAITADLQLIDFGVQLVEESGGYRLVTEPRYARWLRVLRNEPPPLRLSQSALETLAVVAYRQPVTRSEIESIRGVSAEAGVNKLLERELIHIVGRADLPGRPLQLGTTAKFLTFVGIKSLEELPASDVLSNRQIDDWLRKAETEKAPTDAEMGLPLEHGEGHSPTLEQVHLALPLELSSTEEPQSPAT